MRAWLLGLALALTAGAAAAAPCKITPGGEALLIRAVLLRDDKPPARGEVLVQDGVIRCVGWGCTPAGPAPSRIDCAHAVLSPGFINAHEHLPFAHIAPRPDDGVRYRQRHDWRKGLRGFPAKEAFQADDGPDVLTWGELRHLLSGTTSIVGGFMAPGLTRNLDLAQGLEGLAVRPVGNAVFPLDDAAGLQRLGDCDYGPHPMTAETAAKLPALVAHVAEGIDAEARNEFLCISDPAFDRTPLPGGGGTSNDLLQPNLAIVHGVALTPAMLADVARHGASMIWSPRSNLSLYGQTLDVEAARALGINVALGTDWLPSGSISMPREAVCALVIDPALSPRDVWRMMTGNAARALHVEAAVGALRPGLAADLILTAATHADPYESVVRARPGDVMLVIRGGRRLAGAPELMPPPTTPGCESATLIGGAQRTLCIAAETGRTYAAMAARMSERGVWPAAFEDTPPVEPPCARRGSTDDVSNPE